LFYALDDSVWGMKITALEKSVDFATLDTEKLFNKLKSHELSRKGHPNHDASLTSTAFITSASVGGHDANPTNTIVSSTLEFSLSSLAAASDKQYESIPMMRSPYWRGSPEPCTISARRGGDHLGVASSEATPPTSSPTAPRGRSSTPPTGMTTPSGTTIARAMTRSTASGRRRRRRRRRIMSRACATLSDFDFSSDNSSNSEEDENPKCKKGNFTGHCLIGKSLRKISDSDVSDDLSLDGLSLRVIELENALCNQDKLLCMVFHENKKLNLELENSFSKIASLQLVHDDMSAKPCDNCEMFMVNYTDLWLVHAKVASQFDDVRLELRELKARSSLLVTCTSCPLFRSDLETCAIEIKDLKHQIAHSYCYNILSPPCDVCGSLKDKLFHAIKENTELK
jgi:hypothetical protein